VDFLQLVVAGQIDEAYQRHVDMEGRHHNPFFPAGYAALKQGMQDAHIRFPDKQFRIQHVLAEGALVAVHSWMILDPGEAAMITVHLFRFRNGKIVELWDCGQQVPADSPNGDGAF